MFHTVYKTTNLANGNYYIGVHKTENPNDEYLGSGKLLWRAIEKYGWQNFKKEVLFIFETPEEAFKKEEELVDEARKDPSCYNLRKGGAGGFDLINRLGLQNTKPATKAWKTLCENSEFRKAHFSKMTRNRVRSELWRQQVSKNTGKFKGKKHSDETRLKMSTSAIGKHSGEANSQFGTCWVHNHIESKKIKKDQLQSFLDQGWIAGRKIKF